MASTLGLAYVEIGVTDAERSLDFYRGLLGLRPAADPPEPAADGVHWLTADGALVKLVGRRPAARSAAGRATTSSVACGTSG
jgi:catechol 2,3-dioxygenase-like lactoylglutathione lyase family enzyme